ncbi:probable glucuronoxylan glucuronosyltransferase F8H isoform X2 [Vigna radiata var. radiata]|uniref:Probable glucuronoxylan glucuronosyltransferase F8H isoform X2 n=1 Tax=Vigna radiata var. radiata TaxID=3916 RepID=A0A3Q0F637_VIGRR|nr:probable glucuronoxylan glucuronosyltransferase F8H isoform X2 [Vigna radiata var. radiata]
MSASNKWRAMPPHNHQPLCTRTHQIGALLLVTTTFFFTRLLSPCTLSTSVVHLSHPQLQWGQSQLSLKIYVYEPEEINGLNNLLHGRDGKVTEEACLKGQWGTQVKIHKFLLQSKQRTRKKEEADLFFVPSYVKCARMMGGLNDKEINHTYVQVISQMPHFRLSGGRNHIFVFPSGAGAHLFKSWATYINRSIILTPEGDRTDKRDTSAFNTWKDIIIPGNVDDGMTKTGATVVQPLPLPKRKYLANYLGRAQGKAGRVKLIELAKQFPEKECVPVILSDQTELPFQNVIDYSQISIKWPSSRIGPELLQYLESIPDEEIERIIARGREVRCWWVYASDSEPCSAMRGIMWELQRKVRQFHHSAETFWLHNGSIVNRNLVQFSKWELPVPLP